MAYLLITDDRKELLAIRADRTIIGHGDGEVAVLNQCDVSRVGRSGDKVEEWGGVIVGKVVDVHPALEGAAHRVDLNGEGTEEKGRGQIRRGSGGEVS